MRPKSGSDLTRRWREPDSNLRSPLDASEPPTQLGLRSGGGSAYASAMRSRLTVGSLRREDFLEVFMRQIASLTVIRARCSTFGHGPGL